jgi:DNA-binding MarR family transcriptional regulator
MSKLGEPKTKLTERQVQAIRVRWASGKWRQQDLAKHYGVSKSMISRIVAGNRWRTET